MNLKNRDAGAPGDIASENLKAIRAMMFERQAACYDALYQDKDYEAECGFLERVFAQHARRTVFSILDLGCGTGGHALPLARRGYKVTGVDRSEAMLCQARRKASQSLDIKQRAIKFLQSDIRALKLDETFDAVIAMFNVIGYQTGDEDLLAAFRATRSHLIAGGLFIFDAWHGPAVLAQKPSDRQKIAERNGERIIRLSSSTMNAAQKSVQVRFKLLRIKDEKVIDESYETHRVRFFFPQEISRLLDESGLKLLRLCPFLNCDREPGIEDWNFTAIAEAI